MKIDCPFNVELYVELNCTLTILSNISAYSISIDFGDSSDLVYYDLAYSAQIALMKAYTIAGTYTIDVVMLNENLHVNPIIKGLYFYTNTATITTTISTTTVTSATTTTTTTTTSTTTTATSAKGKNCK